MPVEKENGRHDACPLGAALRTPGVGRVDVDTPSETASLQGSRVVLDLVLALNDATTFDEAFGVILDAALNVVPADCGGIYIFDETGESLHLVRHRGLPEYFVEQVSAYGADAPQVRLIQRNEAVFGTYDETVIPDGLERHLEGVLALGVIPVSHKGSIVGALNVGSSIANVFPPESQDVLKVIAAHIGGVLARLRAERKEKRAQENFRNLFHNVEEFVFVLDTEGAVVETNDAACRSLGFSCEELLAKNVLDLHPADRREETRRKVDDMLAGLAKECLIPLLTKDGRQIPVETRVVRGKWNGNEALIGISRDISERKKAEEERLRLVTALDNTNEAILLAGPDAGIRYANPAVERILKCPQTQCLGRDLYDVILADPGLQRSAREALRCGSTWMTRAKDRGDDASACCNDISVTVIRDADGRVTDIVAIVHDITEQVRMEQLLHQSRKMEAIGQFAGGIAHGLNNILAVILGHCELARPQSEENEVFRDCLIKIEASGRRAAKLVKEIRAFSRQPADRCSTVDLAALTGETIQMMRASLPPLVDVRFESNAHLKFVHANSGQLQQVVMSLCINAADALGENGGVISVAVDNTEGVPQEITATGNPNTTMQVRLRVRDTGCGMNEAIMERVFDPFFTTKKWGQGTGLGLSIVHGVVKAHGGAIKVTSAPGKGSCFDVYFPAVPALETAEKAGRHAPAPKPDGPRNVLLVEDEKPVAEILKIGLLRYGYNVSVFHDPHEALQAYRSSPEAFHIVVSDVLMPGMTGNQLAAEILQSSPGMPVILCSGLNDVASEDEVKRMGVAAYLKKPFRIADLVSIMGTVLHSSRVRA